MFSIDCRFKEMVNNLQPMIVFHDNTNLKYLTGTNAIKMNSIFITSTQATTTGQMYTMFHHSITLLPTSSQKHIYKESN